MNPVQDWINEDIKLSELLIKIQEIPGKTVFEQAEIAFDRVCELYDLPKMPEDLEKHHAYYEENNIVEPRSVYEEAALMRFLEPDDDPRGIVLAAIFNVKNNIGVDVKEVMKKSNGKSKFGIRGEKINTEIIFIS